MKTVLIREFKTEFFMENSVNLAFLASSWFSIESPEFGFSTENLGWVLDREPKNMGFPTRTQNLVLAGESFFLNLKIKIVKKKKLIWISNE